MTAAQRWRDAAHGIAVPREILDAAPESPWGFSTATFGARADDALGDRADSVSDRLARATLPPGGSVLDVGSGAGAAGLRLLVDPPGGDAQPVAGALTAVDEQADMLAAVAQRAVPRCVDVRVVRGSWPSAAAGVGAHDVVVCHHVVHNTDEPAAFIAALQAAARRRVVIELTAVHPLDWLRPFWRELHGWDAPAGTSADLLDGVLAEMDVAVVAREAWDRPYGALGGGLPALARRLCVVAEREHELASLLDRHPPPEVQSLVTYGLEA